MLKKKKIRTVKENFFFLETCALKEEIPKFSDFLGGCT